MADGINFSVLVYSPVMDTFAVPVNFYALASQPQGPGNPIAYYSLRGIFGTHDLNVLAEDGSIYSDQQTILDIREAEFAILPIQGDLLDIPIDCNGANQGAWEIINSSTNGGGETTLTLRKWKQPLPMLLGTLAAKEAADSAAISS